MIEPIPKPKRSTDLRVTKTCKICGSLFLAHKYRASIARYCSYKCAGKAKITQVPRKCLNCDKTFNVNPSQLNAYKNAGKYCSRSCSYENRIKLNKNAPIKDKYGRSRRKDDLAWQRAVRERDNYTCQKCGIKPEKRFIHAHHIATRSQRPDLKHDSANGISLCSSCHAWVHHHPLEAIKLGLLSMVAYESVNNIQYGYE